MRMIGIRTASHLWTDRGSEGSRASARATCILSTVYTVG